MKKVSIKVYNPGGQFLKEWNSSLVSFTKEINSGISECLIDLAVPFDYQGGELALGNIVDIYVNDKETISSDAILIYSGYISLYQAYSDGPKEGIAVNLLGHYTKLSTDILKDGTQTKLYTETTSGLSTSNEDEEADIGTIIKAIIDRYRDENTGVKINYISASIELTGTTAKYVFDQMSYREALDKALSMAPAGWFYYIDENGIVYFRNKPTTPTHIFEFGKHFKSIKVEKSFEKVRNFLLIWNGEQDGGAGLIYKHYEDAASIAQYGRRFEKLVDYSMSLETTADKIGAKFLAENKNPEVKVICEIVDNNENNFGYDIEKIQPGDTCRFVGFEERLNDLLADNMLISKVVYNLDRVEITVEAVKSGLVDFQDKTSKKVERYAVNGDSPVDYS